MKGFEEGKSWQLSKKKTTRILRQVLISVLRRISERRCGGGSGGLPPGKNFQVNGGFTHFLILSHTKVGGNTPNEAGFIVPNFHLVRTDYL